MSKKVSDASLIELEDTGWASHEEVRSLAEELMRLRALEAGAHELLKPCSDNHCVNKDPDRHPKGQGTNGGCNCFDERSRVAKLGVLLSRLRKILGVEGGPSW